MTITNSLQWEGMLSAKRIRSLLDLAGLSPREMAYGELLIYLRDGVPGIPVGGYPSAPAAWVRHYERQPAWNSGVFRVSSRCRSRHRATPA